MVVTLKNIEQPPRTFSKSKFGRSLAKNLEEQRQRGIANRQKYKDEPLKDVRPVAPKTEAQRDRLWDCWTLYFKVQGIDPDSIWIDLCEGIDVSEYVREFFTSYVDNTAYERPCLGPMEYKMVQGVNSAVTLDGMWKTLLGKAESGVLQKKRMTDPANQDKWTLYAKFSRFRGRGYGPIYKISKWIEEGASVEHNLTLQQTFEKKEMTPQDIMVLLGTLWTQARHIPCASFTRLAFHCAILIAGIGGFRPGEVMNLTYKQVAFELVRDPREPSKKRLVATITIRHSKHKENVIQHSQHRLLSFSVTLIPCKPICLVSLLVARAIADHAFDADFSSLDDLLNRPDLGNTDSLPLSWAPGIEDKAIIPLNYTSYWSIWHRTLLVAGLRDDKQRPYSLRVGAGGRISGSLAEPVRNYVLGNSRDVFLKSYQPRHLAHDLVRVTFGEEQTGYDQTLFTSLRRSFLRRDPDAPLYPKETDLEELENREDIRALRAEYRDIVAQSSADDPAAKRVAAKILWIRRWLSKEMLETRRNEYFKETDRLRALGQATAKASDHGHCPFKIFDPQGALAAENIGQFMSDENGANGAVKLVEVYVAYLRRRLTEVDMLLTLKPEVQTNDTPKENLIDDMPPTDEKPQTAEKPHKCLFGCGAFAVRGNLTKHNRVVHFNKGAFDKPFECPECLRCGMGQYAVHGAMHWSGHIETVHGRQHAPGVPTGLASRSNVSWVECSVITSQAGRCLICGDILGNAGGFMRHFKLKHVEKQKLFDTPFSCPECTRQQYTPTLVKNDTAWQDHLIDAHDGGGVFGPLHSLRPPKRVHSDITTNDLKEDASESMRKRKKRSL